MSKRNKNKCGPGQILKVGYRKRGYYRKPYTRNDGTYVPAVYVSSANVKPTCIRDMGRPGKGPRTLPQPDDLIHLTKYGYNIRKPDNERRRALRMASDDYNPLTILRRLNLIRNLQPIPENKEIFSDDVEYMKKYYQRFKKSKKQGRKKRSQKGGQDTDMESDTSDIVINTVELPEIITDVIEINTVVDMEKVCDGEGRCGVRNKVYELHHIDNNEVVYYTLEEKDADDVLELDRIYLNPSEMRQETLAKINDNKGLLIGIRVNGRLQGYFHYDPLDENKVKIILFIANKGYRTALYNFLEKYLQKSGYTEIIIDYDTKKKTIRDSDLERRYRTDRRLSSSTNGSFTERGRSLSTNGSFTERGRSLSTNESFTERGRSLSTNGSFIGDINFWYEMGFKASKEDPVSNDNIIRLTKYL